MSDSTFNGTPNGTPFGVPNGFSNGVSHGTEDILHTQAPIHVLVVEDAEFVREAIVETLVRSGHTVHAVGRGREAMDYFAEQPVDLILLDIVLPDADGFVLCERIRTQSDVPIVLLTALNHTDDILRGFELGADDYITKPFVAGELLCRIAAIMRRLGGDLRSARTVLTVGDLTLEQGQGVVTIGETPVELTPIEARLLRYFMERPDRPIAKDELFQEVWGYELVGGTNLVEAAVRRLRTKIETNASEPVRLQTVHGVGYKLNSTGVATQDSSAGSVTSEP